MLLTLKAEVDVGVRVVDPSRPGSIAAKARSRRWQMLLDRFPDVHDMRVLDLGGTLASWELIPRRPRELTLVNLSFKADPPAWVNTVVGDACDPPAAITGGEYDLVFSSSLIEHVEGHFRRRQFAAVVREAAPHYWVQTPYRYFVIEPHWLVPAFQQLPLRCRAVLGLHARGPERADTYESSVEKALSVELLDKTMMHHYFPDAELIFERFAGLPKSVIAVR